MAYRKNALRQPSCIGCLHNYYHNDPISKRQQGVMMHLGEVSAQAGRMPIDLRRVILSAVFPPGAPRKKIRVNCGYIPSRAPMTA